MPSRCLSRQMWSSGNAFLFLGIGKVFVDMWFILESIWEAPTQHKTIPRRKSERQQGPRSRWPWTLYPIFLWDIFLWGINSQISMVFY